VTLFSCINYSQSNLFVVSSGVNPNYPVAGGYGGDYQNSGGAKQQLLALIRSVRTVMRGKTIFVFFTYFIYFSSSSFDCI
jgi:hypothetical protein